MLPSLFVSEGKAGAWSIARAAIYGGGIGALAGSFKAFGPFREVGAAGGSPLEITAVALAFALLCAGAAVLRNFIARQLIWPRR